MLKESEFIEGWSLNTFGAEIDSKKKGYSNKAISLKRRKKCIYNLKKDEKRNLQK